MPRYTVTFERSAVEIKTVVVEADNEDQAECLANEEVDREGPLADPAIISHTNECSPDTESVWEMMDIEELPTVEETKTPDGD